MEFIKSFTSKSSYNSAFKAMNLFNFIKGQILFGLLIAGAIGYMVLINDYTSTVLNWMANNVLATIAIGLLVGSGIASIYRKGDLQLMTESFWNIVGHSLGFAVLFIFITYLQTTAFMLSIPLLFASLVSGILLVFATYIVEKGMIKNIVKDLGF